MEIFGSTFDDSMFSEARNRVCVSLTSYSAKLCQPEWFCENSALDTEDPLEKLKVYKFRGDLALRQKDYQKALDAYSSCLQWTADNNLSIRRDVLEGMSRCCTKLGHRDRALDAARLLGKDVSNTSHLTSLLLLKVGIYQHFGAAASTMASLQQLCVLLPFNPWHWYRLGQTCLELLDADTPAGKWSEEQQEFDLELEEVHGGRLWLKACTCFIRTRLLLRILQRQQSSFVLQRSDSALQSTNKALQRLNPNEETLQTLTEVMSEDLIPEKMREENQDGESLSGLCVQSFSQRWWNKILLTGPGQRPNPDAPVETVPEDHQEED
ncbi:uncharacterized protein C8orf76 homolog isoform X2 [Thalassophryne amazonica]|uniref:uncharacterized protein C8orf76 homolog isoform X2 n=1 Tax=Thalassophryne amazonica TaxID=390379 RepID=UPI001472477B|nr:uncharacterized protein C8orf76 homolog isoform X2 [Thalassophryne amazonica]